jgi:hypothetical protein
VQHLTEQNHKLETAFETLRAITELEIKGLKARDDEHSRIEEELRSKLADLTAKHATLEERSRNQEKTSDRGWNFGQAAVISIISMVGGALLSLLVQLAIKK